MPSQFVVLDESKSEKHPILSVGGIVVNGDDIPEIERRWAQMKRATNLEGRPVKHSMTWPKPELRIYFMELIGQLPLKAVAALLEDFRPASMKLKKETRSEFYVHVVAFEYVLQRLPESIFRDRACAPNFVVVDHRSDFPKFATAYARCHGEGWYFPQWSRRVPSLESIGFTSGLHITQDGALNEIADMTVSCITRWAGARAAAHRGKTVPDLEGLDREAGEIIGCFPCSPTTPPRRQGFSLVTFKDNRTGKEVLAAHIDAWAQEISGHGESRTTPPQFPEEGTQRP
jgi:hypothetical protein